MTDLAMFDLDAFEEKVRSGGPIDAEDVLMLRKVVYGNGEISPEEARLIFRLNRVIRTADPSWADLYVEALSDFFLRKQGEPAIIGEEDVRVIRDWIGSEGKPAGARELRLLVNLIARAEASPEHFRELVMESVKENILTGNRSVEDGSAREPGVIDDADVEILRRILYAPASEGGIMVTRREAELLFELNFATDAAKNSAAWQALFVKAITMYILSDAASPETVDADEANWLLGQVGDRARDNNAKALIAYLAAEAKSLHPSLDPMVRVAGEGKIAI